jgi:hypothetical protein
VFVDLNEVKDNYVQSVEKDCQSEAGTNIAISWRELE